MLYISLLPQETKLSLLRQLANRERCRSWKAANKQKVSAYNKAYKRDTDVKAESDRRYREENASKIKESKQQYYRKNCDKFKASASEYARNNRNKINQNRKNKIKTDIGFKLAMGLRIRMNKAIENGQKTGSAVRDLGCSIEELKRYLESKFDSGMSWDNYGLHGWHIDHIRPLSSFNLENREEFLRAAHYTNLQPLWAHDNLRKGDRVD